MAELPGDAVRAVAAAPGVRAVTLDGEVALQGTRWRADGDANSMYNAVRGTGHLRQEGCNLVHGYHISKPLPADEFADWLAARVPSLGGA